MVPDTIIGQFLGSLLGGSTLTILPGAWVKVSALVPVFTRALGGGRSNGGVVGSFEIASGFFWGSQE